MVSVEEHKAIVSKFRSNFWKRSWASITEQQQFARKEPKGSPPANVNRCQINAQQYEPVRKLLLEAVEALKTGKTTYAVPDLNNVTTEWVSGEKAADALLAKDEVVDGVPSTVKKASSPVILYIPGGGFYFGGPIVARPATTQLAKALKGHVVAVQYRYATEQPFPGALLDVLITYVNLLRSIPARRIVIAAESAGLNIAMALIQVLLHLQRQNPGSNSPITIDTQGTKLSLQLPRGIAGLSGFFDPACGLPSWHNNGTFDILPELQPNYTHEWPSQDVWPSDPPRADVYCERDAMTHPLVNLVLAKDWTGCPPVYLAMGEERNTDSSLYLARQMVKNKVPIRIQQWEKMPHIWPFLLPKLPQAGGVMKEWFGSLWKMMAYKDPKELDGRGELEVIGFENMKVSKIPLDQKCALSKGDIVKLLEKARDERILVTGKEGKTSKI